MKRLFISTTNSVDNGKVQEYYGVVSAHIVAGTGFFSDLLASIADIVGGRSASYRQQLESLYEEALDEVSDKARILGGNGILGLKIDLDNISGKGMSMFMISAVGTAVKIQFDEKEQSINLHNTISSTELISEIAKRSILAYLSDDEAILPRDSWKEILKTPDNDYVAPLTKRFFEVMTHRSEYDNDYCESFRNNYELFVQMSDRDLVVQNIYQNINSENGFGCAKDIVKKFSLFDAKGLLSLIKAGLVKQAVALLEVEQPSYSEADLNDMEELVVALENLPDAGKIEVIKGGVFSKDDVKFICAHGHKNNSYVEFCNVCSENIKGLTMNDIHAIENFKKRVLVLNELLSE